MPTSLRWPPFTFTGGENVCNYIITYIPSPTHVNKSWYGGKVPTFNLKKSFKHDFILIEVGSWFFYVKILGLVLRVELSLLFNPTFNTKSQVWFP